MHSRGFLVRRCVARVLIGATVSFAASGIPAQDPGSALFQQTCSACHKIGGGRLVGPDLAGVTEKRTEDWLVRFIKSSQSMVRAGDPVAVALYKEYNQIPMPDQALSDVQIRSILKHIKTAGGGSASPEGKVEAEPVYTSADVVLGRSLFQGKVRFQNGGASCISCHHVKNDAVIGGGILAKDLTTVFSRMGGEGVRAIIGGSPFPVMQAAYRKRPLTDEENRALVAFLQQADRDHAFQRPRDYGWGLFGAGCGGVVLLLGLYWVSGRGRKKRSVNQDIYDRQIKSE